jgi:hypothetical protein
LDIPLIPYFHILYGVPVDAGIDQLQRRSAGDISYPGHIRPVRITKGKAIPQANNFFAFHWLQPPFSGFSGSAAC